MNGAVTHTREFCVRHYECDAYGHVNNANYLRYMQEAAMEASAAVGYDHARYENRGSIWLPRRTTIEYKIPLVYDQRFEIKTWVEDFRRVRSRRIYEFRHVGETELVARAKTDWIYLDRETHRPISVPEEMIKAFYPGGDPQEAPRREPFPKAPPAPPGTYTFDLSVKWRDVDSAGHVNNANYLSYLEDTGFGAASACGWPIERSLADGFGWVAREADLEYHQQAHLGDQLTIDTYVSNVRSASLLRHYFVRFKASGELVTEGRIQWAYIDVGNGRPARIPPDMGDVLAVNCALKGSS